MGNGLSMAASLEDIRKEFGLKRRRTAEVLVKSALKKFKSHLAILAILDLVFPDHEEMELPDGDLEYVAEVYVRMLRSGEIRDLSIDCLTGESDGT
jgi:hypothetical protein